MFNLTIPHITNVETTPKDAAVTPILDLFIRHPMPIRANVIITKINFQSKISKFNTPQNNITTILLTLHCNYYQTKYS